MSSSRRVLAPHSPEVPTVAGMGGGMGSTPHLPAEPGSQSRTFPGALACNWGFSAPSEGAHLRRRMYLGLPARPQLVLVPWRRRRPGGNREPGRPSLPAPGRQGEEQRRRVRSWMASPLAGGSSWSPDKGQVGAEGAGPQETNLQNVPGS